jgi:hypothetical protein
MTDRLVHMTCCNTRYETIAETLGHVCPADSLTPAERETIDRHFGTESALDWTDAILVTMILDYIRRSPSINRRAEITLAAIAALSEHNPTLARTLMTELTEASF